MAKVSKCILVGILILITQDLFSQTYIYRGNSKFPNDVMFNIIEGELREARNGWGVAPLFTVRDNQIFKGQSISLLDVLFTYRDGYLFLGYSENPYDIVYNFDGEHIYFRERSFPIDIAYTIFYDGIYPGPTTFVSDVLFTIDGPYTETELFLILYALGLL